MSSMDPVVGILAGLDRPVEPRPEFAESLLTRLLEELVEGRALSGRGRFRLALPRLLPGVSPRLRLVLIVIAVLLLLAGIATATFFGVKTWVSSGPRGVQFTSDFRLVVLARDVNYGQTAFAPGGGELYGIRIDESRLASAVLVRATGLARERLRSRVVLRFHNLKDAALWDPGTDLSGTVVPEGRVPAVADNGDAAFIASMTRARTIRQFFRKARDSTALLVRHTGGRVEKVLTVRELVDAGLLVRVRNMWFTVAFSSPDRVWLLVQDVSHNEPRFRSLYEVVDPNGDGDWSDRQVTPFRLPVFLGFEKPIKDPAAAWYPQALEAEPSVGGEDRSRSFLLMVQRFGLGEQRVYAVSDRNGDGDARDGDEFQLLFSGKPSGDHPEPLAPRVVVRGGKVAFRELLLGGLTTGTRVSRVTEAGKVIDIARAFSGIEDVAGDAEGNVYVLGIPPNAGTPGLFKLKPVPVGARPQRGAAPVKPPAPPTTTVALPRHALRIAVGRHAAQKTEFFLVGTNGRRLGTLFSGGPNGASLGPQSPSGSHFVYRSDSVIPNEAFTYVGGAEARRPGKVAEKSLSYICWLSEGSLALEDYPGRGAPTLSIYDVRSGTSRTVLRNVAPGPTGSCSTDGRRLVLISGIDTTKVPQSGKPVIELLDPRTGQRQRVTHPLGRGPYGYSDVQISPDGRRIAYTLTRTDGPQGFALTYAVYLRDLTTGSTRRVHRARAFLVGAAYALWSPTSDRLALSISRPRPGRPCTPKELERHEGDGRCQFWDLALVDAQRGTLHRIVSAANHLGGPEWSPDGRTVAFSTGEDVSLASADGATHRLRQTRGYTLSYFGWSPDGRYLGLARLGNVGNLKTGLWTDVPVEIALLDVASGKVRTLMKAPKGVWLEPTWWR